jgi:hypothetical protein
MDIIQQLPSTTGNLKVAVIRDVKRVIPLNGYMLNNKLHDIILCELATSNYPIGYFPDREHRDKALDHVVANKHKAKIVLDYNQFYFTAKVSNNEAKWLLVKKRHELFKSLQIAVKHIGIESNRWCQLDAFCLFPSTIHNNIRLGIAMPIRNLAVADVWAKTLYSPKQLPYWGISKLQYWTGLILMNNENFYRNPSDHVITY